MFRSRAALLSFAALFLAAGAIALAQDPGADRGPIVPDALRDRMQSGGRARVIVELRVAGSRARPEADLGSADRILAQRQNIAAARGRVLSRLGTSGAREARRYQTLPYVALDLGAADLERLESSPDVIRVVPDTLMRLSLESSVPRMEGDQVWQAGYTATGSTVAVIDSGVDAAHPFLAGKVVDEACFSSSVPGLTQSVCPNGQPQQFGAGAAAPCNLADCYHGTHVAGIAAGSGVLAGVPFSGVARDADLAAVQVLSEILDPDTCGGVAPCLGGFESDIIAGLEHVYALKVAGRNIASVNMSLGGGAFDAPCDGELIKPAIDNLRALGVPTIVASGNSAEVASLAAPACISSAVSVGATTLGDEVAWFSNVAPFLSLLAPGDGIISSVPGAEYDMLSGTSMAAPHVAGAWALVRQASPGASVDDVLTAFRITGAPVTDLRVWADGLTTVPRIRTFKALAALTSVTSPAPSLSAVTPPHAREGLPLTLTLTGTGFNALSVVRWNGVDVPSVADSVTRLTAVVPVSALVVGAAGVHVFNPGPGGGTSSSETVEILPPPSLAIDRTSVAPGSPITVTLANGYGNQLDWLAVAAAGGPDLNFLESTFVGNGVMNRTWTVSAPATPGPYEFRLFLNNGFVRLATSPTFVVDASIHPVPVMASMTPAQTVSGSAPVAITVLGTRFVPASAVAWNGSPRPTTFVSATELRATIPASDLTQAGSFPVTVVTPTPGGGSSNAVAFTVIPAPVLAVSAASVAAGASVTVTLTNGFGGSQDWLAFAPAGAANNAYEQFTYVGAGVTTRSWTVTTPSTPGPYEFRLFQQGSFTRIATSPVVTIQAPPPPTLSVSSTSISGGQTLTVTLANGQGGSQDWLSFGSTSAANNAYLQFTYVGAGVTSRTWTVTAPNTSGSYEFRLFKQGSFVRLATSPAVTVVGPPPPPPMITVSAATVAPGASVTASVTNAPGGSSDSLVLAAAGSPDSSAIQSVLVGAGVTSRTWTVAMPATPGVYEFRLLVVAGGVTSRAATSPSVMVQVPAPPALNTGATSSPVGAPLTVTLVNGAGGSLDWIALAPVGAPNNSYVQMTYVGAGVTTRTWTVTPATAGSYEFRLFHQGTFTRLATSAPITVNPPPPPVLAVSASSVSAGQPVTVTLSNGPGGGLDWLAFAPVGAPSNIYVAWVYVGSGVTSRTWTVTAPSAGNYEFRLFRQASFVLAATSAAVAVVP